MKRILISGGTGLIGRYLITKLIDKGYDIGILTRKNISIDKVTTIRWDPISGQLNSQDIKDFHILIHLAGANIGEKRWNSRRKNLILESRVKSASLLFEKVKESGAQIDTYITASAIGYYGAVTSEKIFSEDDPSGSDFIGETCRRWEETAEGFSNLKIRVLKLRTGVVLDRSEGALARMALPVKLGLGSAIGSGNQYIPWIHPEDLANIYIRAIEDTSMTGAYNAVSPEHVTNREFSEKLTKTLGRPFIFPAIPSSFIRFLFGEMADIILEGSRVSADRIIKAGFRFNYPELESALKSIYKN